MTACIIETCAILRNSAGEIASINASIDLRLGDANPCEKFAVTSCYYWGIIHEPTYRVLEVANIIR